MTAPSPEMLAWRAAFHRPAFASLCEAEGILVALAPQLEADPFIGDNVRRASDELRRALDKLTRDELYPHPISKRVPRSKPRSGRAKFCRKCTDWLPLGCFEKRKTSPDGLATECRACKSERRARAKNNGGAA